MAGNYLTTADGVGLYYETLGTGGPAILFPNSRHLQPDFTWLAGRYTLIFVDTRNRGRSGLADPRLPARGVHDDVDDIEAVRRHFALDRMILFGHSYSALVCALYAMTHAAHVSRAVLMSPAVPHIGKHYPPHLSNADEVFRDTMARLARWQAEAERLSIEERCRRFWSMIAPLYVADAQHADRITWARCDEPNEVAFMKLWLGTIVPSLQALDLAPLASRATMPMLIVHGRKDRSAAYGGAREWAMLLPDARLITVEHAAHAPWLERPDLVLEPVGEFLEGRWPATAERVLQIDDRRAATSDLPRP